MKKIVILGATGGVAVSLAEELSKADWNCFLIARNQDKLNELKPRINCPSYLADCSNWEEMESAFAEANNALGGIDCIVNCCGSLLLKPAHLTTELELQSLISKNLITAFIACKFAGKYLVKNGGSVVLFSSAAAQIGLANHEGISAVKGGIEALVRSAAATYASKNIRFNAIAPGLTRTPLTESIFNNENNLNFSRKLHSLKRLGEPQDLVEAVKFLISDQATWITGQVLNVDGGLGTLKTNQ